jgi:hypothetical protein
MAHSQFPRMAYEKGYKEMYYNMKLHIIHHKTPCPHEVWVPVYKGISNAATQTDALAHPF